MKLIVGLGNIGTKYDQTRHNVGFWVVDEFVRKIAVNEPLTFQENKKFHAFVAETTWQKTGSSVVEKLYIVKPTTYMNASGESVAAIANFYKIPTQDIWVLHDDVDFPVGVLKIREGGASAGHNGIASVIESLGEDMFWRFRIGVGRPMESEERYDVARHVLDTFSEAEHKKMKEVVKHTVAALELALEKDMQSAMNRYNIAGK